MPLYFWSKELAILITRKARYVVPAVIAAGGVVVGYLAGMLTKRKTKKAKAAEQPNDD